ncbi:hypothetical protein E2562_031042 [Oryza meyeriana var. granulata]|uniref:Uncharacterized protein n=1 Tax=Oryza meyeriana var. granulata TaxID=110450 RepID=A0A6G1FE53_9ORYZ|nr:hypothetical protein E2562_031042 [Oryza meyeriana var. granulata]
MAILDAAKPLLEMLHSNGAIPSSDDTLQLPMHLQNAPAALKSFVKEKATLSSSQTIAVVKSLYPQVDI